ncbi:hypothetical protein HF295_06710 [Hujiaoplasma nucleasis]|uniref:Uncharacterized protein n=1 Tax=Hujiaoplasma nucleasis TaxID=2725268 RepID=A0A7L6N7N6_9MOLU|nr:hypothetical protein [Hujiaoplasma nucleasis]QLY40554.1 hypothetical protein HF295_06710 [Hujiaoplasma nucleasis]
MKQNLYLFNGKDYLLFPRLKNKEIIMKHVQTQSKRRIPFQTKTAVRLNFHSWLNNQEIRLPNTFIIKASEYDRDIIKALKTLGINPPKKSKLKNLILFHNMKNTYKHIHLDDINETLIPTIHYNDIHKVVDHIQGSMHDQVVHMTKKPGMGLFADQVY